jgi:molybdopterin converting factor subunit 1
MTVTVFLFARARELAGGSRLTVQLPTGATVADLRSQLAQQVPALAELLSRSAVGINGEFTDYQTPIPENAEIALLPPVSGG